MQTRTESLIESAWNMAIGYAVAIASQLIVFPIVGVEASLKQNLTIGLWFTAISIARQYVIRRLFDSQ